MQLWLRTQKNTRESKQVMSGTKISSTKLPWTDQTTSDKLVHLTGVLYSACSAPTSWSTFPHGKVSRVPERWSGLLAPCLMLFLLFFWSKDSLLKEVVMDLSISLSQTLVRLAISRFGKALLFKFFSPPVLPSVHLSTTVDQETEAQRSWQPVSGFQLPTVLPRSMPHLLFSLSLVTLLTYLS